MKEFRIFTESKADIKFLKDYIEVAFGKVLPDHNFDPLGSWSGYKAAAKPKSTILENFLDQKDTILILDADKDYKERKKEVSDDFQRFGIPFNLFLFPNHESTGNLETLLASIAVKTDIIRCFEGYEKCIDGHELPASKSKIFAYLDALLPEKHKKNNKNDLIQDANRDYKIKDHWNLSHASLTPLKEFLSPYFLD